MGDDANRRVAKRVGGRNRPLIEAGVNNVSGYQRQEAGHERVDVLANSWKRRLSHVLTLVPLKDDPSPAANRVAGEAQVRVKHGTRPPLQDDDIRALLVDEPQRP